MFVDKVELKLVAGKGGDGFVSFRREKFVERGGPDGGDGGDGGDIFAVGSENENTLAAFRYKKVVKAKSGSRGGKSKMHGASASPLKLKLPVGTIISTTEGKLLADITKHGQEVLIAEGGKGGFGNAHFVSSRRRTPKVRELGEPGQTFDVIFELKMIADVGLVGLPNAGKSTLLGRISNAHPAVANYPFTTLEPHLGVVDIGPNSSLLFADIPGLIKGASKGKGLGDEFLRHVERTSLLVHLIDAYQDDIAEAYNTIQSELKNYPSLDLSKKPQVVIINKTEGMPQDEVNAAVSVVKSVAKRGARIFPLSAKSGEGVKEMLYFVNEKMKRASAKQQIKKKTTLPVIKLESTDDAWKINKKGKTFIVSGIKVERFAVRTDFNSDAGIERLRDILRKMGIMHELERKKINPGDKIQIGTDPGKSFEY